MINLQLVAAVCSGYFKQELVSCSFTSFFSSLNESDTFGVESCVVVEDFY